MEIKISQIQNGYTVKQDDEPEVYFKSNRKVKALVGDLLGVPRMIWKKKEVPVVDNIEPVEAPQV